MKNKVMIFVLALALLTPALSCKDTKREQEKLDEQLKQIEAVETTIDSTLNHIDKKVEEIEDMIKEIDSL